MYKFSAHFHPVCMYVHQETHFSRGIWKCIFKYFSFSCLICCLSGVVECLNLYVSINLHRMHVIYFKNVQLYTQIFLYIHIIYTQCRLHKPFHLKLWLIMRHIVRVSWFLLDWSRIRLHYILYVYNVYSNIYVQIYLYLRVWENKISA